MRCADVSGGRQPAWQALFSPFGPAQIGARAKKSTKQGVVERTNRPLAAKPSRDLLFIKLWAATLRMPEMEKSC